MMEENSKALIAHIRDGKHGKETQSLYCHLAAVSRHAGKFARKIGLEEAGKILGLLHDFGKASEIFQNYLLSAEEMIDPDADGYVDSEAMHGKIDHSTAGAQLIYNALHGKGSKEKIVAQLLALCIASHHSGLIDCLTPDGKDNFQRRINKADAETHFNEVQSKLQNIHQQINDLLSTDIVEQVFTKLKSLQNANVDSQETAIFKVGLLIRFLLSCLVDADRLDTADFESPGNLFVRNYGQYQPWNTLVKRLDIRLQEFSQNTDQNPVNSLRAQVSEACVSFADRPKGIYQLTVPTGGGKTLSSLRFALNHAKKHAMDRVFYIIPYTSIIDQNADDIRKTLEDKDDNNQYLDRVVLEHHSNLTPEEESYRQKLLSQNWDAPIVLTTQVQFLETLFGYGTRGVRRMHQLANSVIILDEVQTIPINTIQMLNVALRFLVENCGATVVLCTATQPPLNKIEAQHRALTIESDQHIIEDEQKLYEGLRRVQVFDRRKEDGWSDDEVAELAEEQLYEKGSVLAVVNTRDNARALYQAIVARKIEGLNLYHLSTNMCPAHRLAVLEEIKNKLGKEPVICVSTQLIEAGVDIDFGAVIRYLAGLDSIAQAAGRCNRHGSQDGFGNVWIVNPQQENIDLLIDIRLGREQAIRLLDEFAQNPEALGNDRIGLEAMAQYYRYYFHVREGDMRYPVTAKSVIGHDNDDLFNVLAMNTVALKAYQHINNTNPGTAFFQSFQSAAKTFKVINSATRGIVVPYLQEGDNIITELCSTPLLEKQFKLLKQAQRYSVNVFPNKFQSLLKIGAIHEVQAGSGIYYLGKQYYHKDFGWSEEIANRMDTSIE
jgi:CRISPR-associated endonuclease/helicase Cas3